MSISDVKRDEAEEAVRTLIRWCGDDPTREGVRDTPERVVRAFEEMFSGYHKNPEDVLKKTFEDVAGYSEMIVLRHIDFTSYCEHHMAPIVGCAHVGYLPAKRIVGISKLARVVDIFARRLQTQEKFTSEIAHTIDRILKPLGVGVVVRAQHHCLMCRGVNKTNVDMISSVLLGTFRENARTRSEFLDFVKG